MRRHRSSGGGTTFASKSNAAPLPDALSLIRTFNSETNPARPVRPSPLTASQIQGMPLDLLDRIRTFPLFLSAPESFLVAIGSYLRPQLHSPHDYILTEGDEAKAMYWLVRGAVAVTSRDGESTYAELKPGAFFGEIGVLMNIPRTATIIARSRCLLVVLKQEDLRKELPKYPEVERAIREEAQERLVILERKKRENSSVVLEHTPTSPIRGEKRSHDGMAEDVTMFENNFSRSNGLLSYKKRKSPSPGLAETTPSSALGSGLVNVRQLLKELPLFSTLPPEILHFLGLSAQPRTYPPFTDIIKQDSQGREVFFIVRGEVEVVDEKGSDHNTTNGLANGLGRETKRGLQVKARLKQGQYFGEVASLSLAPRRTATVRSVSSVECLMIGGDVLAEFWKRFPLDVRQQVERTAKERLQSSSGGDAIMVDVAETTPPIDELAIGDSKPKVTRKQAVPKVTFSHPKPPSPHKPSRIEDQPIIEPCDPDPFLNVDLENIKSRSRRGSLAPPPPDGAQATGPDNQHRKSSPPGARPATASPSKPKHASTPPEQYVTPKRPKTIQRRPSQFSKGILPESILILIFQYLDIYQLMRIRTVSLHWCRILSKCPDLLHTLNLTHYNRKVTDEALINYICPFVGQRPRMIDISNCFHISDGGFTALASNCASNVTSWKMKSVWDITAHAVLEMANKARGLEEVDLSNCRKVSDTLLARVVGWVVQGPAAGSGRQQFNARHPGIRSADGTVVSQPPPGTVFGCPKLRRLTLSYCKHVSDRSMAHLACHAASRLEEIDLTRCTTITDQGFQHWGEVQFSRLTKLCLADCTYLTDNAIVYLTNAAKTLRELNLVIAWNGSVYCEMTANPCIVFLLCALRYGD